MQLIWDAQINALSNPDIVPSEDEDEDYDDFANKLEGFLGKENKRLWAIFFIFFIIIRINLLVK